MGKPSAHYHMSQLEREFELEMGHSQSGYSDDELERELETAIDTDEESFDSEMEYEIDEQENEYEFDDDVEGKFEVYDSEPSSYAERLHELGQREFEYEFEMEAELDRVMDDMHREFFLGGLIKGAANLAKNKPMVRNLVGKGLKAAASFIPGGGLALDGLKMATGLVGDSLKARARSVASKAVKGLNDEGATFSKDLAAKLGIKPGNTRDQNMAALNNLVAGLQRSFEFAADHIHEEVDDPIEAERLAGQAFEVGLSTALPNRGARRTPSQNTSPLNAKNASRSSGTRVIHLREKPGTEIEKIVIVIRDTPR
jgi:hypothetical protein